MSVSMTTSQVAVVLGVRSETIRRYVEDGKLLASKDPMSGRLQVSAASLAQFICEQQLLGKTLYTSNEITTAVLEKASRTLVFIIVDAACEESFDFDQKALFELAWSILSTRFIPEWDGVGKKYRRIVLHAVEGTRGNQLFAGLELAFQLYDLRVKEQERVLA
ncbi:MAG: hypothetical protein UV05_C0011G0015 [candidate division CPR1 bacterium GW2011_GWA2_42_17]|uniref:Helix-turn-helix domain-containing protein n=1 Tax=candidate division CPR1 bacterium GW2011_GWA2_42_17 TaxID=1618341 RepID=A0A0G0Z621_9BACT|nr:MAG: hypothetical protein UV05_C0011G0015 [candidate division CPR1 bacterium GW2011_GWA2_42_17]